MPDYKPPFVAKSDIPLKSYFLYENRRWYREKTTEIYEDISPNYLDLWYDVPYYGKVNPAGQFVFPNPKKIIFPLGTPGNDENVSGFDFALECIGRPLTMRASYDAIRRGGTACIVGVGRAEEMVEFSAFELFFMEKTLVGSYYGGTDVRSDFHKLLRLYKQGQLDLEGMITRRIKIDEINPALEAVRNGEVIRQVIEF